MIARPRFLLAVCESMRWTDAGVFETAREAEREREIAIAQGAGDTQIIQLRTGDDPLAVLASMKRALVIAYGEGPNRSLLVGFWLASPYPNPTVNMARRPMFRPTADAGSVVKFETVPEAHACLRDVKLFAPDAVIQTIDWREAQP